MYHSSSGKTPIDFGSKVKVTGQGSLPVPTNLFLNNSVCINQLYSVFTNVLLITQEDPC